MENLGTENLEVFSVCTALSAITSGGRAAHSLRVRNSQGERQVGPSRVTEQLLYSAIMNSSRRFTRNNVTIKSWSATAEWHGHEELDKQGERKPLERVNAVYSPNSQSHQSWELEARVTGMNGWGQGRQRSPVPECLSFRSSWFGHTPGKYYVCFSIDCGVRG